MQIEFEQTTCGRCGGTGRFGPVCVYNGICFWCSGSKVRTTPAGKASAAKYERWAATHLAVPFDALVGGPKVKIPRQFGGFNSMGEVWYTFPGAYRVLACEERPSGAYDVTLRVRMSAAPAWLRADAEAGTVTISESTPLRRRPTRDELLAIYPTLGVGATLREDDGTVLQQNVKTEAQIASAERAAARKAERKAEAERARQQTRATVEAALAADKTLWTTEPHPSGFAGKTYRDYATWCLANAPQMAGRFAARLAETSTQGA